ncbi:hypothetical protein [Campylobacter mucosalis]|uniref:hypothetical protein n=1 Tax=Campylobacter mucosalis TaxID=202 RepID=UPI001470573B|nr:hypothetical protein [Campylobacter mucosalis]
MKKFADDNIAAFVFRNLKRGSKILRIDSDNIYTDFLNQNGFEITADFSKKVDGIFGFIGFDIKLIPNAFNALKNDTKAIFCFIDKDDFRAKNITPFSKDEIRKILRDFDDLCIESIVLNAKNSTELHKIYVAIARKD